MKAREKKEPQTASPASFLTNWDHQGVQSFVAAQKMLMDLLDLAAGETAMAVDGLKEGCAFPSRRGGGRGYTP